ncbi:MAG: hypothetical protein LLF76_12545 [Planctomycetaceae bacterium]|nr:hypothetical protein [Planctomycetaceae bacterium]
MRKSCLFILVCVLVGNLAAETVQIPADVSCRTDIMNRTINRHDSNKLTIRGEASSSKSWVKWNDLDGIDVSTIRHAELRLTTYETRPGTFSVSAVNDNYLNNIDWAERYDATPPPPYGITWDNASANSVESYTDVLAGAATLVGTMDFTGTIAGDQRFIDVTSVLQADTDGIVQFILHNGSTLMNMCTHDQGGTMLTGLVIGPEQARPYLFITLPPEGADWPQPEVGKVVLNTLSELSWTNPEPNVPGDPIWCDVYLGTFPEGTEPNRPQMSHVALGNGIEAVAIADFPEFAGLENNKTYYWFVDCHDPSKGVVAGEEWSFFVGVPPVVDAGPEQVLWLGSDPNIVVSLDGTVTDDGPCTYSWTVLTAGAPAPSHSDTVDTSVVLDRGVYEYRLTATDSGGLQTSDTVRIVVGNDACDASHLDTEQEYNKADINQDCIVDLQDFVEYIAANWLECSDTMNHCAD